MQEWLILALIGLAAGAFGGMVGLGGGVIMIPAMVIFLKLTQHQAQGISLTVMLPPVSIFAVYNYWKSDYDPRYLTYSLIIASFFVVGGYFGSKLAVSLSTAALKKVFAISMIVLALNMLFGDRVYGKKSVFFHRTPPKTSMQEPASANSSLTSDGLPDSNTSEEARTDAPSQPLP